MAKSLFRYLASLLLVLGLSSAANAQTPAVNPDLTASCGSLHVGVVIDVSGSIAQADYDDMITSLENYLRSLADNGNRASIATFSTTATVREAYFDITTANIDTIIPGLRALSTGGNTNYEAGFRALLHSLDGDLNTVFGTGATPGTATALNLATAQYPDLLLFFTDGWPNTVNASDTITDNNASTSSAGNQTAADRAINEVNAFKAQGTHVFSLTYDHGDVGLLNSLLLGEYGLLSILGTLLFGASTPDYAQYIITEITGPSPQEWNGSASTFPTADYTLVNGFANVFDGLADFCLRDLSLSKTVDNGAPDQNSNVTFTLTVDNASTEQATGVAVTDLLPAGLTYVSDTGGGAYVPGTGVWTIGTIAGGGSASLTITATVTSPTTVTNVAEITAADQNDPDSTVNNGDPTEDDYASVDVKPTAVNPDLVGICENLDIGVVLDTSGSIAPADYALMIASLEQFMLQYSGRNNFITISTFDDSANLEYAYTELTTANSAAIAANLALIATFGGTNYEAGLRTVLHSVDGAAGTTFGLGAGENLGAPRYPDLLLFFTDGVPNVQQAVDDFTDNGTATVASATEADAAAAAADEANEFKTNGSHFFAIVYNTGGSTNEQFVVTELTGPGATAWDGSPSTFQSADYYVVNSFANIFTDIGAVCESDLALTKTVDNATPNNGTNVVFTVTVTNQSLAGEATSVVVQDYLPAGLTYVSDDGGAATAESSGTITWTVGTLAVGASATLNITATVGGVGSYTNRAEVFSMDQNDTDSTPGNMGVLPVEDDEGAATVVSAAVTIDLSISKTADNTSPAPGDIVTYTVTVTNTSTTTDATNVVVTDILPAQVIYQSDTPPAGTTSNNVLGTLTWNIPTLTANSSLVWTIVVQVDPSLIP